MNSLAKKTLRLIVIIAAGTALFWYSTLAGYWIKEHLIDAWRVKKHLAQYQEYLEAPAKNDPYGSTESPQETFRMFLEALKNEDLYLASRYFVLYKQDEWYETLQKIKENGDLDDMISDLERAESYKSLYEGNFQYLVTDKDNIVTVIIDFTQNPVNHRWKISEL